MNINLDADEIILWLRKNKIAVNVRNEELGKRIQEIILDQNGQKIVEDQESHWAHNDGDFHIVPYVLPKTAVQYEISSDSLPAIFDLISQF